MTLSGCIVGNEQNLLSAWRLERLPITKMADEQNKSEDTRNEKIKAVSRDFEQFFDDIKEKNKDYKYEEGLNFDNLDEELEKIPLFMKNVPEEIDPEKSPALAALQAIKYELDTPEARAEAYKEDGNIQYKKKQFKTAIKNYSEGIKIKCEDGKLNAVLYTNRATSHSYLGNNRSALNDAKAALKFCPDYMKAITRGAVASFELKLYEESLQFIDRGLSIEPENTKLLELRMKCLSKKKQQERDRRKEQARMEKERNKNKALISAIKAADVTLEEWANKDELKDDNTLYDEFVQSSLDASESPTGHVVHLDDSGSLHWPVMFLYPEYGQTDFVSDFNERHRFEEQLQVILADFPPWDTHKRFNLTTVEIYFEEKDGETLRWVDKQTCLRDVLATKTLVVCSRTPSFILLAKGSPFTDKFYKRYKFVKR